MSGGQAFEDLKPPLPYKISFNIGYNVGTEQTAYLIYECEIERSQGRGRWLSLNGISL